MRKRRVFTPQLSWLICVEIDGLGGDGFDGDGFGGDMIRGHPSACLFVARLPPLEKGSLMVVSIP